MLVGGIKMKHFLSVYNYVSNKKVKKGKVPFAPFLQLPINRGVILPLDVLCTELGKQLCVLGSVCVAFLT